MVFTALHPSGDEDNHEVIFAKYAATDAWVAVHLGQFIGVLLALGGLLVLHRILRASGQRSLLADLAAGSRFGLPPRKRCAGSSGASRASSASCSGWLSR